MPRNESVNNIFYIKGECVPRLCAEGRVFVEKDEMCHHVNEEGLCPRNQRLYLTASGHAVCDCPDGMFQGKSLFSKDLDPG